MPCKILFVDNHPVVELGVRTVFEASPEFEFVATARIAGEVVELAQAHDPDVMITEVRLDDQDALKLVEQVKVLLPKIQVVVFSQYQGPIHVARASALGVYDYISKSNDLSTLVTAVKNATAGVPTDPNSLLNSARSRMKNKRCDEEGGSLLTNREMQVIRHVAMGLKNREIGLSLEISVETVKEHVQNMLRKMGVNDRTQAAVTATKKSWI